MGFIYVDNDILPGEDLSSIKLANMDFIYWSVLSSSSRGDNGKKRMDWGFRYFSQLRVLFYQST